MTRFVLHVGPGKCGSSSIQSFLASDQQLLAEPVVYRKLTPALVRDVSRNAQEDRAGEQSSLVILKDLIRLDLRSGACVVWSHEMLFHHLDVVRVIAGLAAELAETLTVIGYSRRQSSFLISAYKQWHFRSSQRVKEVKQQLAAAGFESAWLTGVEGFLLACVVSDFHAARQPSDAMILNWLSGYSRINQVVLPQAGDVQCGVLPDHRDGGSLIEDFCGRIRLRLRPGGVSSSVKVANPAFDADMVEAMHGAVALGLAVPGPHEANSLMQKITAPDLAPRNAGSPFLQCLSDYVDTWYWEDNQRLCRAYGLDPERFRPARLWSKEEILAHARAEIDRRSRAPLETVSYYRDLAARLIHRQLRLEEQK